MDSGDLIEILITVGVFVISVVGALLKEKKENRQKAKSRPQPQASARQWSTSALRALFDNAKAAPQAAPATDIPGDHAPVNDMPGDWYCVNEPHVPAVEMQAEQTAQQPAETPVIETIGSIGTESDESEYDSAERRRLIDNLIMGEILARKF